MSDTNDSTGPTIGYMAVGFLCCVLCAGLGQGVGQDAGYFRGQVDAMNGRWHVVNVNGEYVSVKQPATRPVAGVEAQR